MAARPDPETQRLAEDAARQANWKRWGPYLSERQWGTVREDYSPDGNVWDYFPHDHARGRSYRWGEDGILGICDRQCRLCFALALWNGRDPILKERLFGVSGHEGNHGEDVKEEYFYLDSTPTHSYMKGLYKYPQAAFPYATLIEENRRRTKDQPEFEIADTGVFDAGRYFDITVEYAKASPNDILIRITAANRAAEPARLYLLPTLWFRNTWAWGPSTEGLAHRARIARTGAATLQADHATLGRYELAAEGVHEFLFTENDTNMQRLYGAPNAGPCVKDAFHDCIVNGLRGAVSSRPEGTKAAAVYVLDLPPHGSAPIRLRLSAQRDAPPREPFGLAFDAVVEERRAEADEFYNACAAPGMTDEARRVARQAYAGLLWSKQFYHYGVNEWLDGDPSQPPPPEVRKDGRNREWRHVYCRDVISMPDKWEYPWFAAWDLAFHMVAMARVDPQFAKEQLILFLREWYMHPSGQIPAYEFAFGDVNPPVHAWACWRVYKMTGTRHGSRWHGSPSRAASADQPEARWHGSPSRAEHPDHYPAPPRDRAFLARAFQKLLINFTWWVNRKDPTGRNIFAGGFLGMDNVGVFDRNMKLPDGVHLDQADGTAWMAFYCGTMLSMALELAEGDPVYEDVASKFFEHFVSIVDAMNHLGGSGLWDEEDGFYYDQLWTRSHPLRLKVRSMVGMVPLLAVEVLEQSQLDALPGFSKRMQWFLDNRKDLSRQITYMASHEHKHGHRLLAVPSRQRLLRVLGYLLDEDEFLSPHGIRSLSKFHERRPYSFEIQGSAHRVDYAPGESTTTLFGGNSNWRGPIWIPLNFLLVEALERYHHFYEDTLTIEFPKGSGRQIDLAQAAAEIRSRLCSLFLPDPTGNRPCHGGQNGQARFAADPHWRDLLLFHEYFHGETGKGLGATHQTGWTALIATLLRDPQSSRDAPGSVPQLRRGSERQAVPRS